MRKKEFTEEIQSDYETSHTYTLIQHPGEEGFAITQKLIKIVSVVAPPFIDAVASNAEMSLDSDIREAGINGESVAKAINSFAAEVVSAGGVQFAKELLKYTTRNNDDGKPQLVGTHFNEIYQGNYGEMVKAIAFSLRANFGPSLRAILGGDNISRMTALLQGR